MSTIDVEGSPDAVALSIMDRRNGQRWLCRGEGEHVAYDVWSGFGDPSERIAHVEAIDDTMQRSRVTWFVKPEGS